MAKDSRIMLNVQRIWSVSELAEGGLGWIDGAGEAHLQPCISVGREFDEREVDQRRANNATDRRPDAEFPCLLPLPSSRVDARHQKDDIASRERVEELPEKVPRVMPLAERRHHEDVNVARAEDRDVEDLGDEGDAFGAAVGVDGPYQDEDGDEVGEISEYAEDVEVEGHGRVEAGESTCWPYPRVLGVS